MARTGRRLHGRAWWAMGAIVLAAAACGSGSDDPAVDAAGSSSSTTTSQAGSDTTDTTSVSTTTTSPSTTTLRTEPEPDPSCAANPVPSDNVLDTAVHLLFDRTPLDLDGDGRRDEILSYEESGRQRLLARLAGGWTPSIDIGEFDAPPGLITNADGAAAAHDLDGDGGLEFFYGESGGSSATLVSYRTASCTLLDDFVADDDDKAGTYSIEFACGENCFTRVECVDDEITHAMVQQVDPERYPELEEGDVAYLWVETRTALHERDILVSEHPDREQLVRQIPEGAPTADDTGFINCSP